MKKTCRSAAAAVTAALMAAAMMVPAYAADTESPLLTTSNGQAVAKAEDTDVSQYNEFFEAIGATEEQRDAIYLDGQINLDVGETIEIRLAQPSSKAGEEPDFLLVGEQAAVSITGPKDGKTLTDKNGNVYYPLTVTGKAEGTDIYVADPGTQAICAYKFVVGSGEGANNQDPALYIDTQAVSQASATINYDPSPVGVTLSTAGSSWLSQGYVKENGKKINGKTLNGHAQYSSAAPKREVPKTLRIGILNVQDIITISNNSSKAKNPNDTEPARLGMLNAESIISIDNRNQQASTPKTPEVQRIGMLNEESVISIDNRNQQASTPKTPEVKRNGMLNPEDIIKIL